ncbi:MAG: nucleotidyltransferase family protein [Candidatus Omnitrophica bacterium]|nr:nucleotidyltransferase family protein [Candidatus Omnitrophota bacterium]
MKYKSAFHLVSSIAKDKNVALILIGGFAVNEYNYTRSTADIDFLITENDYKKIESLLKKEGYFEYDKQSNFIKFQTDSGYLIDIDFMFVDSETMDKISTDSRKIELAGQPFSIPSLDHLIALKLHSIKHNPKVRTGKDLIDIIELIAINNIDISSKKFKDLCLKYGTEELYNKIVGEFRS